MLDPFADRDHRTDDLVPWNQRQFGVRQLTINDVQVGSADAAGMNLEEDFAGLRCAPDQPPPLQWLTCGGQHHRISDPVAFGSPVARRIVNFRLRLHLAK